MTLTVVPDPSDRDQSDQTRPAGSLIDEIVREGAHRILAEAPHAEVDAYIAQFADQRDEQGRRLVVRNGYHQPREPLTPAGAIEVQAPRVNDKRVDSETGERQRFSSAILPPWCRKTPKVNEVLPLLTCTASPRATSYPRSASSSAPPPGCRRRSSPS